MVTADTDIGTTKKTNQDSVLVKHASSIYGEVLMAVICDGMGGMDKGELASAVVIRTFAKWFHEELPLLIGKVGLRDMADGWENLLKNLNAEIGDYGRLHEIHLGTTFTGVLFIGNEYLAVNIGDTRLYQVTTEVRQLTTDHTLVAQKVRDGEITSEEAKTHSKRNVLLQCVGASDAIRPEVIFGQTEPGTYFLCSDGFRHEISEQEIFDFFQPAYLTSTSTMHERAVYLISEDKSRMERDNISVVLIKASEF